MILNVFTCYFHFLKIYFSFGDRSSGSFLTQKVCKDVNLYTCHVTKEKNMIFFPIFSLRVCTGRGCAVLCTRNFLLVDPDLTQDIPFFVSFLSFTFWYFLYQIFHVDHKAIRYVHGVPSDSCGSIWHWAFVVDAWLVGMYFPSWWFMPRRLLCQICWVCLLV